MEDAELEEYKKLILEISDLKDKIEGYLHSNQDAIEGMTYGDAVKKLWYLRNKQRITPKAVRERYVKSKWKRATPE